MDALGEVLGSFGLAGVSVFVLFAALNAFILVRNLVKHDRHVSMIPLIGGLSGLLGCLAIPSLRYYALAPLVLDVGTAFGLVGGLALLKEVWQTCRCNLLSEYVGFASGKTVRLRLFRHGVFTLQQELQRAPGGRGIAACSTIGEWSRSQGELRLGINGQEAVYRIVDVGGQTTLQQAAGFPAYESDETWSLAGISLRLVYRASERRASRK